MVLLKSESRHKYVMKMACALYGLCMEELLLTLRKEAAGTSCGLALGIV